MTGGTACYALWAFAQSEWFNCSGINWQCPAITTLCRPWSEILIRACQLLSFYWLRFTFALSILKKSRQCPSRPCAAFTTQMSRYDEKINHADGEIWSKNFFVYLLIHFLRQMRSRCWCCKDQAWWCRDWRRSSESHKASLPFTHTGNAAKLLINRHLLKNTTIQLPNLRTSCKTPTF